MSVGCSEDTTFNLRWKGGREDYPPSYQTMEARGPTDIITLYRLGKMDQPYHTFEVMVNQPVKIRITGAKINEAWGGGRNRR